MQREDQYPYFDDEFLETLAMHPRRDHDAPLTSSMDPIDLAVSNTLRGKTATQGGPLNQLVYRLTYKLADFVVRHWGSVIHRLLGIVAAVGVGLMVYADRYASEHDLATYNLLACLIMSAGFMVCWIYLTARQVAYRPAPTPGPQRLRHVADMVGGRMQPLVARALTERLVGIVLVGSTVVIAFILFQNSTGPKGTPDCMGVHSVTAQERTIDDVVTNQIKALDQGSRGEWLADIVRMNDISTSVLTAGQQINVPALCKYFPAKKEFQR